MTFEALFLSAYAALLLLIAAGLRRLGNVNPSPWSSRVLAGHRRRHLGAPARSAGAAPSAAPPADDPWTRTWPHREQPRLHTGMALVAALAALVLSAAGLLRHRGLDALPLTATACAAGWLVLRLGQALGRR